MTLTCSSCGAALPSGSRFCNQCGTPVGGAQAGPARDPRSYTPNHLVEKILNGRDRIEGERKQVTVLFADVKGSMELADQIELEDWHGILDGFFRILADGVHRFEGTVNQYTGDGIMALFGAPIAHEDHAQRACHAALHLDAELRRYADEIRRTRGRSFAVRMGLNSGEVVVGKIGDDLRMDYTAQGQVVNLAARMEQLAEPGRIYLTRSTADLVAGFFGLRELGAFDIKGVNVPVEVSELQGVGPLRTRLDVSRARGFTRFVGREREMAALEDALEATLRGEGRVVCVAGDAGLGKSRLCHEFAARCLDRGIPIFRAQAVGHGKGIPYLPVLDLLRAYFGVTDRDDPRAVRDKIAGRMVLLDESLTESVPLMLELLGVPDPSRKTPDMEPGARQRRLFEVVTRMIRAQHEPEVFLLEDLHWLDGASEAFLASVAPSLAASRSLLLVNSRPEYRPEWAGECVSITLAPLGERAIDALCADLLGSDRSLEGLERLVRERTGGSPFFIEEIVHDLAEAGVLEGARGAYRAVKPITQVTLPASVQAVIAARIDRLPDVAKQVLQTAAVIGKEFPEALLRQSADVPEGQLGEALRTLTAAEMIYPSALYPEPIYTFKHPLTLEVAYRSQLAERRRRLHGVVARALQEQDPSRLDERAALLAHHWESAGEPLEAARWGRRAAIWARSHDISESMAHWRKVRALLASVAGEERDTRSAIEADAAILGLGWLVGISPEEATAVFEEGKSLVSGSGGARWLARLVAQYAGVKAAHGEIDDYLRLSQEAVRIADESGDPGLQAAVRTPLIRAHLIAGKLREGLELVGEALERVPPDPEFGTALGYSPYLNLSLLRADLLSYAGRWRDGVLAFEHTMRICREHGHEVMLAHALIDYGWWAALLGDGPAALASSRQGLDIAERLGSRMTQLFAYNSLGFAELAGGDPAAAVAVLEQAIAMTRGKVATFETHVGTLTLLSRAYLANGDVERARTTAEEAVTSGCRWNARAWECKAQLAYGFVLLRSGDREALGTAEGALQRAMTLIEETGAKCFEPFVHLELAELARQRGDAVAREEELRTAHRLLSDIGASAESVARL